MVLTFILAALTASVALLRLAYVADRSIVTPSLLSPAIFTTLLFLVAYTWRPVLYIVDPFRATVFADYHSNFEPERVAGLMLACAVGIAAFNLGFGARWGSRIAARLPELEWRNPWYVMALLLLCALLAFIALRHAVAAANIQSLWALGVTLRRSVMQNFEGNGPLLFFVTNLQLWFLTAAMLYIASRGYPFAGRRILLIFVVGLLLMGILGYLMLLSRTLLLSLIALCPLIVHYYVRRISFATQLIFIAAVAVLAGILGLFMIGTLAKSANRDAFELAQALMWRVSASFDQFEDLYLALSKTFDFHLGLSFLQDAILTYVPRALWPGKPEIFGFLLLQNDLMPSLYQIARLTATYPVGFMAEAYMNFGLAGFVLAPFSYGMVLRIFAERGINAKSGYALLLLPALSANIGIVRSLGGFFSGLVFGTVVILLFVRPVWRRGTMPA